MKGVMLFGKNAAVAGHCPHAKFSNVASVIGEAKSFTNAQSHSQSPPPGGGTAGAGLFQAQGGESESERFMRVILL